MLNQFLVVDKSNKYINIIKLINKFLKAGTMENGVAEVTELRFSNFTNFSKYIFALCTRYMV